MKTNNHKIVDYDLVLDAKFSKVGTPERAQAEEAAFSFYSGQILQNARKEAKVTQEELARRTNTTKSYISKVENGVVTPCRLIRELFCVFFFVLLILFSYFCIRNETITKKPTICTTKNTDYTLLIALQAH